MAIETEINSEDLRTLTVKSIVDDEDIYMVTIISHLNPGKTSKDLHSFSQERALLKYISGTIPVWAKYCIDNGMKTL